MKRKRRNHAALVRLLPLLSLMSVCACSGNSVALPYAHESCAPDEAQAVTAVSVAALLRGAAGVNCSGRVVRVTGFLVWEFEDRTLFESWDRAEATRWGSTRWFAIHIDVENGGRFDRFQQQNVIVEGRFFPEIIRGEVQGRLTDVTRMDYLAPGSAPPRRLTPWEFWLLPAPHAGEPGPR